MQWSEAPHTEINCNEDNYIIDQTVQLKISVILELWRHEPSPAICLWNGSRGPYEGHRPPRCDVVQTGRLFYPMVCGLFAVMS